jgi:hypothetical protein
MNHLIFIFLTVFTSLSFAERSLQNDRLSDEEIYESIQSVLNQAGKPDGVIDSAVYAIGTQMYQLIDDQWVAKGPWARLAPMKQRRSKFQNDLTIVGFHNQNIEKPSWELHMNGQEYELLAKSATAYEGASSIDVPWLFVELEKNDLGFCGIVRAETRGGIAPSDPNYAAYSYSGVGYQTIYGFIRC